MKLPEVTSMNDQIRLLQQSLQLRSISNTLTLRSNALTIYTQQCCASMGRIDNSHEHIPALSKWRQWGWGPNVPFYYIIIGMDVARIFPTGSTRGFFYGGKW